MLNQCRLLDLLPLRYSLGRLNNLRNKSEDLPSIKFRFTVNRSELRPRVQ